MGLRGQSSRPRPLPLSHSFSLPERDGENRICHDCPLEKADASKMPINISVVSIGIATASQRGKAWCTWRLGGRRTRWGRSCCPQVLKQKNVAKCPANAEQLAVGPSAAIASPSRHPRRRLPRQHSLFVATSLTSHFVEFLSRDVSRTPHLFTCCLKPLLLASDIPAAARLAINTTARLPYQRPRRQNA